MSNGLNFEHHSVIDGAQLLIILLNLLKRNAKHYHFGLHSLDTTPLQVKKKYFMWRTFTDVTDTITRLGFFVLHERVFVVRFINFDCFISG